MFKFATKINRNRRGRLVEEYIKKLNSVTLWPLKFVAYLRFETKDGRFIEKLPSTVVRSIFMLMLGNCSAAYLLYETAYKDESLLVTETITVAYIVLIQNLNILNISFPNRNSGLIIINTCIEIDVVLGIIETKFMRDIATATFVVLSLGIALCQIGVSIILFNAYLVSIAIHVVGTIYFIMVYLIFYDACFLVSFYTFLSLRVQYINVALIKLAKVNPTYFANQFFFNGILWRRQFDKFVTFHNRAKDIQFIQVFGMIFEQQRRLERYFRFTIFVSMTSIIVGTFLAVQTIIIPKHLPNFNTLRIISVAGWVVLGWIYLLSSSQHADIFHRQIEKTKLICTYIQLKPFMSAKVLKLTKQLLRLLELHEPRVSVYGMYYFSTLTVLQIVAAVFVYITVQLQLSLTGSRTADEALANVTKDSHLGIFLLR